MPDCKIRRAIHADLATLAGLFDDYRQFYRQPSDKELARRFLQARLGKNESVIFVAELDDGEIAGFCQIYPSFCSVSAARIGIVYDLFTRDRHRKRGIGNRLLAAAEQHARENGLQRLELATARDNQDAQALYHARGWVRDEAFLHYACDTPAHP